MEDSTATPAPSGTTPPDSPRTFNERFAQYKQGFETTHPHVAEATSSAFQVAHAPLADGGVSEVNIFDFDGTLFRSPEPNFTKWSSEAVGKLKGHPRDRGLGWFQEVSPPHRSRCLGPSPPPQPFLTTAPVCACR